MTRPRPYISRIEPYYWMDGSTRIDGIALRHGPRIIAHLKPEEALELSNRLVDLTEELEGRHDPAQ